MFPKNEVKNVTDKMDVVQGKNFVVDFQQA